MDFPMKKWWIFPVRYVSHYQRVCIADLTGSRSVAKSKLAIEKSKDVPKHSTAISQDQDLAGILGQQLWNTEFLPYESTWRARVSWFWSTTISLSSYIFTDTFHHFPMWFIFLFVLCIAAIVMIPSLTNDQRIFFKRRMNPTTSHTAPTWES